MRERSRAPAMASGGEKREHTVPLLGNRPAELTSPASPSHEAETYTTDGSLDFDGSPALKHRTGGWKACRSILATEFCYGLAFGGISYNLVSYLTTVLQQSNVAAARNVSTWQATCFLTPVAGAVLADSYWGRYRTMVVSFSVGVAGLVITALSAYLPLFIQNTTSTNLVSAQQFILFLGLYMAALGLGSLRPCLTSFGADQFDDGDPLERTRKGSFFNWYLFTMKLASVISTTGIVWVQDHYGWALGLTVPAMCLAVGLVCLVAASRAYRFQRNCGSPLTRVCQEDCSLLYESPEVDCSMKGVRRMQHTCDLQFFDKAAIVLSSDNKEEAAPAPHNPWRLCGVTQVEELKILVRMLPLWATVVFFYAVSAQVSSTFVEQGTAMDTAVGSIRIPPASLSTFDVLTTVVLVPLYDRAFVPAARRLTGHEKGVPELQRIGVGLAMPVVAMAAAALLETARLRAAKATPPAPPTSVLWQTPQYALVGVGEVFATIGQFDFFYSQAPPAMKTVCAALGLVAISAGKYLSSFLLAGVDWATASGGRPGWIPDDLNEGHLDWFFWLMAGLGCLNLVAFGSCAVRYKYRKIS